MLMCEAETVIDGETVSFEVWEILGAVVELDLATLALSGKVVRLSTVRPMGEKLHAAQMQAMQTVLVGLVAALEYEPCPYCDATGKWDTARQKDCPYCAGSKQTGRVNLAALEKVWAAAITLVGDPQQPASAVRGTSAIGLLMNLCQCGEKKVESARLCPACEEDAAGELDQQG